MADEISAPGGGAPVSSDAAPASSPAPVTPAAPATPAAAAPATPVPATPAVPAAAAPSPVAALTRIPGEDDAKFLQRVREARDAAAAADPAKPAEPVKAVEPAKPAEPAKPVEAAKPAEPAKVEEKPAEEDPLDKLGPLPASKMAELLSANPELDAALDKAVIKTDDGQEIPLKDALFESLRSAAVGQQFREVFPDVETAKFASERAAAFGVMDQRFTEIKPRDIPSTVDFIRDVLMPQSFILDEKGEPRINPQTGQPMTDGTVTTFLDNIRDVAIDQVLFDANNLLKGNDQQKEIGESLLAAVDTIKQFVGGGGAQPEELNDQLKAQKANLDAREQALAETKRTEQETSFKQFTESLEAASSEKVNSLVEGFLSQSSLAPNPADGAQEKESKTFLRDGVLSKIRDGIFDRLSKDPLFKAEQEQIARRGPGEHTKTALVNLYDRHTNAILEKIASPILRNAGAVRVKQSQARHAKLATQNKVTQMEPRGGTVAALPQATKVDGAALMRQAKSELTVEMKRQPTDEEAIKRFNQLKAAATAKSA